MSGLAEYRRRRDFGRTAEPAGDAGVHPPDGWFVIQKHAARRLHYDLRLAIGGVLVSWAVARVPSLDPTVRRLAVRTEDHPLSYGDFEGTIPKGEYGGGTVLVWDRGPVDIAGDPATGLAGGSLEVTLHGRRLTGGFRLVRLRPTAKEPRESWLLIKKRDESAAADIDLAVQDTSVDTGRTLPEVAAGDSRSAGRTPRRRSDRPRPPRFLKPQLAAPAEAPPTSGDWLYELKFDGYRLLTAVAGPEVRCYTRSGLDWTARFGPIVRRLATLGLGPTLLDGEVVAVREGRAHRLLRSAAGDRRSAGPPQLLRLRPPGRRRRGHPRPAADRAAAAARRTAWRTAGAGLPVPANRRARRPRAGGGLPPGLGGPDRQARRRPLPLAPHPGLAQAEMPSPPGVRRRRVQRFAARAPLRVAVARRPRGRPAGLCRPGRHRVRRPRAPPRWPTGSRRWRRSTVRSPPCPTTCPAASDG